MFVIGVSGVTNGGKSSLCRSLLKLFPRSTYLCQDTFFHKRVSGKLEYRSDLQSHNYDCIEAIDLGSKALLKRAELPNETRVYVGTPHHADVRITVAGGNATPSKRH